MHAAKIASTTMAEAVKRADIDPAIIDDVRCGCCIEPIPLLRVSFDTAS
jgi:acetyl-CoA C-acetyltransferase